VAARSRTAADVAQCFREYADGIESGFFTSIEMRWDGAGSDVFIKLTPCLQPLPVLKESSDGEKTRRCMYHSRAYGGQCDRGIGHEGLCSSEGDAFKGGHTP